jgi:mannosyl-3-phosphoglycerate phosphatase
MPYLDNSLLIFTDLDGSLLDHDDYSWKPAQGWLDKLAAHQVPVVITTSKTAAEVMELQKALNLTEVPFIAENGAVIALPESWGDHLAYPRKVFGAEYGEIRKIIDALRLRYDFECRGFGDVNAAQVADWTGLPPDDAQLAMTREGSEPLVWFGDERDLTRFEGYLNQEGLTLTRGGRFWHVMGAGVSKGQAVQWLAGEYRRRRGHPMVTLGLGDGPNDLSMLDAVDHAVVIRGHHDQPMPLKHEGSDHVFRTTLYGPQGWKQGLDHFIKKNAPV